MDVTQIGRLQTHLQGARCRGLQDLRRFADHVRCKRTDVRENLSRRGWQVPHL